MADLARLPVPVDLICRVLASGRLDLTNEKATQRDIHELLAAALPATLEVEREVRLSARDIPDFVVGGEVVIEVKIRRASAREALAQAQRYAAHDTVRAIIVATNRAMLLPATVCGKELRVVGLGRAWL